MHFVLECDLRFRTSDATCTLPLHYLFTHREAVGVLLADFVIRVHQMFASKGTFSPRLFSFLGIDFEKVQSEEVNKSFAIIFLFSMPALLLHTILEFYLSTYFYPRIPVTLLSYFVFTDKNFSVFANHFFVTILL